MDLYYMDLYYMDLYYMDLYYMGWTTGLEPATPGTTSQCSTN
jgi:hypothetical protein